MLESSINQNSTPPSRLSVADFPLSQDTIHKIIQSNQTNQETCIELDGDFVKDWESIFGYLSYYSLSFHVKKNKRSIENAYIRQSHWFKKNNLVWDFFQRNQQRLKRLLIAFLNPDLGKLQQSEDDLEDYSLSELSILEFSSYISDFISREDIRVNKEALKQSFGFSSRRSLIYSKLFGNEDRNGELTHIIPVEEFERKFLYKFRDTLKKNVHSSSLPLGQSKRNTINLHLEVLNSCDQACPGCFVKRKNSLPEDWTKDIDQFLTPGKFNEWNEVVVGPTDIFSATNFYDVFKAEDWVQGNLANFSAITFNSTLNMPDEQIIEKFTQLKDVFNGKQLEFFIIVDIHKFLAEDPTYMEWLKNKISLLENSNIILTINTPEIMFWRFESPGDIAYRWFNKNFKYTLSFFRSNNKKLISKYLKGMNEKCHSSTNVINYTYDRYFGGTTYTTLVYKAGELYWSPCVVDFVFIEDSKFKISTFDNTEDLRAHKGFGACLGCPEQDSCRAKGVLAVKDYLEKDECILPQDFAIST